MKWISTRGKSKPLTFSEAILEGLAPDGGLFVPEYFSNIQWQQWNEQLTYQDIAYHVILPFLLGDRLEAELKDMCKIAFNFPVKLKTLTNRVSILELFHGQTAAFKDFGARFLAECMVRNNHEKKEILILAATSGDTGGAVAAAFHQKPNIKVGIFFPRGKVSKRQEKQLTCWGENIFSFSVNGTFDDCQKLVKEAFTIAKFKDQFHLTTSNSINIGRLLPQIVYYFYSSIEFYRQHSSKPNIIIPTGNAGNATAAFWAKMMGAPIDHIILAVNENKVIPDYLTTGNWKPKQSLTTLANAMDVGNPSNMERLIHLFNHYKESYDWVSAYSVSDDEIRQTIINTKNECNEIICPHTAVAMTIYKRCLSNKPAIVVSTAHPAKFENIVEPLIHQSILIPPTLNDLLELPSKCTEIEPLLDYVNF